MAAQFHYFYRIENLINGNFYYGIHNTSNLNDNYFGSGVRIKSAIKKYGIENFKKENLLFFESAKEAFEYESEFVSEELIIDPSCYNLMLGGKGGNNGKPSEWYTESCKRMREKLWSNEEYRKSQAIRASLRMSRILLDGSHITSGFRNKNHSKDTKQKMRLKHELNNDQQGNKNSQFGTCWITNGIANKKITKNHDIPSGWHLGRKLK